MSAASTNGHARAPSRRHSKKLATAISAKASVVIVSEASVFPVALRLPDQAELPDIGADPAQQFAIAQHAPERAVLVRRSLGFDDFVDRAAFAGEFRHAASMRLSRAGRYAQSQS